MNQLNPFHEALQHFSSDNLVTISLVFPFFECLKDHLGVKDSDVPMIKDMKGHMLNILGPRHPYKQQVFLELCSLLDPRFKQQVTLKNNYNKDEMIEQGTRYFENAEPESHDFFEATEG